MGILSMSRAIGMTSLKHFGLTSEPDIRMFELEEGDSFIIAATDGVFDILTNQEAVDLVKLYNTPQNAAAALTSQAYLNGSYDNMTALVIRLKGWGRFNMDYTELLKKHSMDSVLGKRINTLPDVLADGLTNHEVRREWLIEEVFSLFDSSMSGRLSAADIKRGMAYLGHHLLDDDVAFILSWADLNGDGSISKEEFLEACKKG